MITKTIKGSAKVTTHSIKKKFRNFKPIESLYELIWNGFDAGATEVQLYIKRNELEGIDEILISDNGSGIDFNSESCGFNKYDDSEKKNSIQTHGKDGVGRFGFHKISHKAEWHTKNSRGMYKTTIDSTILQDFDIIELEKNEIDLLQNLNSGTVVRLIGFDGQENLPSEDDIIRFLSIEFGWYLAIKENAQITFNEVDIEIPQADTLSYTFEIDGFSFYTQFYRWYKKPSSEKSYDYYITNNNNVKSRELSGFNKKPNFYLSTIIKSDIFNDNDLDLIKMNSELIDWSQLNSEILNKQESIYLNFLQSKADEVIESYEEKGFFLKPKGIDREYDLWRNKNIKIVVKELYINDPSLFNNLKEKPAKILIRLLDKLMTSNENDSLIDVLEGVLDLEADNLDRLSKIIKDSSLENIISTVEEITKRLSVVRMIRDLMEHKYHKVLETPDLQKIIENNSWLFGEQYSLIGAEEDDFNKLSKNLRSQVQGIDDIDVSEIDEGIEISGAKRQVDFFLASKNMSYDESNNRIYKCLIIEIKRPSISLNKKHLRQVEDYAEIISKHPSFGSERMRFELILIGRKISKEDTSIKSKLKSAEIHQEKGLINKDEKIKTYIRDWFSILDEHELSHNYLLDKLKPKLPDYTDVKPNKLIENLQS